MLYPPFKKLRARVRPSVRQSVHLSVRPYIRPSISASFQLSARFIFQPMFFKLEIRVDIGKMCLGIADG